MGMSTDMRPSDRTCAHCGKQLTMGQQTYCSRRCGGKASGRCGKGPAGMHWNGGRQMTTNGYVRIWTPDGYRYEHRIVAEQTLGRSLERTEQVHHLNGDKTDNRPENLVVLGIREHALLHEEHHFKRARRWSVKFDACIDCGRTSIRHSSHGRCGTCASYWRKAHPNQRIGKVHSGANR